MRDGGDFERGVARIADQQIREAMDNGQFDKLPGAGQPIPDIDEPYTDDWWVRKWMKRERLRREDGGAT